MTEAENTTTMQADLRAVDDALGSGAAGSADPLERELQELALALRAESPEPSPGFASELRARVRDGFPRERRLPRAQLSSLPRLPRLPRLRRPALPVLAGVASVLVALTVAISLQSGGEKDAGQGGVPSPPNAADEGAAPAAQAPASPSGKEPSEGRTLDSPTIPPGPPPERGFSPGERERRIERSASLTLAAPEDRLDGVADGIVRLTDRFHGFVLRSSLSTGAEGTTGGDFELRIPAGRLQAALGELSKLGEVRARTQSGQDVTPTFVSAAERLQAARAERRSLLRRLERAPTDSAADSIRRRLDLKAGEIRGLRGELRELRTRTDYADVSVALEAKGGESGISSPDSGNGLGGALDDALRSLGDSLEIAIRVLGVLLPVGLLAAALGLGACAVRRRRREAALG